MLVLSRKESETVLFPKLGITVEVSRIQGKTVRIGIDAPDEIRVIRGELEDTADLETRPKNYATSSKRLNQRKRADSRQSPTYSRETQANNSPTLQLNDRSIQNQLDATNLAIHLAQNLLRQQLTGRAEDALNDALECLDELEQMLANHRQPLESVREVAPKYELGRKRKTVVLVEPEFHPESLVKNLEGLGYLVVKLDRAESLVAYLKQNDQPNLVVAFGKSTDESNDDVTTEQGLRIFGVGSLLRSQNTYGSSKSPINLWFAEPEDRQSFEECVDCSA